jgi:hypothetical protein
MLAYELIFSTFLNLEIISNSDLEYSGGVNDLSFIWLDKIIGTFVLEFVNSLKSVSFILLGIFLETKFKKPDLMVMKTGDEKFDTFGIFINYNNS